MGSIGLQWAHKNLSELYPKSIIRAKNHILIGISPFQFSKIAFSTSYSHYDVKYI